VAKILIDAGCPEDGVVAGILHDTVEDTPVSLDEIRHTFGETVARIVEGASEPDKSKPWEERKAHTIEFLKTASEAALLVSCADKIENLEAIREDRERVGEKVWARFRRGRDCRSSSASGRRLRRCSAEAVSRPLLFSDLQQDDGRNDEDDADNLPGPHDLVEKQEGDHGGGDGLQG
jgi:hypothetical protein